MQTQASTSPDPEPSPPNPRFRRLRNFLIAGIIGCIAGFFMPHWFGPIVRAVAGYDVGVAYLLVELWYFGMSRDAKATESRAAVEDPGRNVDLGVVLLCIAAGVVAAVAILGNQPHVPHLWDKLVIYIVGIGAVVLGWLLVHTVFTFRYAHLYYYQDDSAETGDHGLDFPKTPHPNDDDFAYFSFVVGMTFQVSDVQITDQGVRRVCLMHALISFVYNTAIVALGINLLSGLFH